MIDRIPPGLVPSSGSLDFTQDTMPEALKREHSLGEGRWGVLHVFEGTLRFVNLVSGEERVATAPDLITIHPGLPHNVAMEGPARCRIDFFREPDAGPTGRIPGAFADESVRRSLQRCEENGDFGQTFYDIFLDSSDVIASYFAGTDFDRQRRVLRESVHMMATKDVADPEMREALENLGEAHSRRGRNVLPSLYEVWLDSICRTVRTMDPHWDESLERKWRVRLRPGIQIIMAAY